VNIAFDLDGTLLTCRERQVAVAVSVAADAGLPAFDAERFWRAKRRGSTTREALVEVGLAPAAAASVAAAWVEVVEDSRWLALDRLRGQSLPVLRRLRDSGHEVGILTARVRRRELLEQVEAMGLAAATDYVCVVDPADASPAKARELVSRAVTAYVGDSEVDLSAAEGAGVPFAAVDTGQRTGGFLRRRGATSVHRSLGSAVEALLAADAVRRAATRG
jgi:phosphoglycolate phosphatase-like HAD superfamily hydrolase